MVTRISIWNPEEGRPRKSTTLTAYNETPSSVVQILKKNLDFGERPHKEKKEKPKSKKAKKAKKTANGEF